MSSERHIVRELYPNSMPMLIQGAATYQKSLPYVDPDSCNLYPVIGDTVLPASPILDTKTRYSIAMRLTDVIRNKI